MTDDRQNIFSAGGGSAADGFDTTDSQVMKVAIGRHEMTVTAQTLAELAAVCSGDHMPTAIDRVESIIISMYRGEVSSEEAMAALGVLHDIKYDYELLLAIDIKERKEAADDRA